MRKCGAWLFVGSAMVACMKGYARQSWREEWRGKKQPIQITLSIPATWQCTKYSASDENGIKRIEYGSSGFLDTTVLSSTKNLLRQDYDADFQLILTESENEAETGDKVVKGQIYELYVIYQGKHYQRIFFYDWQDISSQKTLFIEIIKNIRIQKF